jgi:hypothetical protein
MEPVLVAGLPLKVRNRPKLLAFIAANLTVLILLIYRELVAHDPTSLITEAKVIPLGVAFLLTTVLNGFLSNETKARLVFLRWTDPLPGREAFTKHGPEDVRVDMAAITAKCGGQLPTDARAQNATWYRFYREIHDAPGVEQVHQDFLLMRDCTGLAFLFLIAFGVLGFRAITPPSTASLYFGGLLLQFGLVRQAAVTYGHRFVATVLACAATQRPGDNKATSSSP